jgi:hypothetical protein
MKHILTFVAGLVTGVLVAKRRKVDDLYEREEHASLADTQPVKVYDDTVESMPFSVAYCLEQWAKESE